MVKLDAERDPRIIPFGVTIRTAALDELPQLVNVLRGEMSFVGPRPCIPYEYDEYDNWHRMRTESYPGLTGLWQVSGKNRTTFTEMMRYDISYAHHISLWLDLSITLRTVFAIAAQFRA
jgi:lipopolysaccharide/colanic/teichoic acid biosynthesis glycosyltransferase